MEEEATINPSVGSLLALSWSRADLSQSPPLKLVWIIAGKLCSALHAYRLPNNSVGSLDVLSEAVQ